MRSEVQFIWTDKYSQDVKKLRIIQFEFHVSLLSLILTSQGTQNDFRILN